MIKLDQPRTFMPFRSSGDTGWRRIGSGTLVLDVTGGRASGCEDVGGTEVASTFGRKGGTEA